MDWRFTLSNTNYTPLIIDEPIGWDGITINLKRDLDVHGLTFEYSVGLKFIDSGYEYIKKIYNTYGIDQYVELLVEIKCSDTDPFESFYIGKLLMGKLNFDCTDLCFVETTIEPSGCQMTFQNRIDQKIELAKCEDIDQNLLPCYFKLPFDITMKPKLVTKKSVATIEAHNNCYSPTGLIDVPHSASGGNHKVNGNFYFSPKLGSFLLNEVVTTNLLTGSYSETLAGVEPFIIADLQGAYFFDLKFFVLMQNTLYSSNKDTVCLTGTNSTPPVCNGYIINCSGNTYSFPQPYDGFSEYRVSFNVTVNDFYVFQSIIINSNSCYDLNSSTIADCRTYMSTLNLNHNDVVKIFYQVEMGASLRKNLVDDGCAQWFLKFASSGTSTLYSCLSTPKWNVSLSILYPASNTKAYMINEALSRSVEGITNDCLRVYSNYFGRVDSQPYNQGMDGCGGLEMITNGLHLRQFPDNKIRFAVSFKDLYEGLNSIHNIGYGIEPDQFRLGFDVVRVEPMLYWYDSTTTIMTCDNIPSLKRTIMADWYLSLFAFGYEKWEAEQTSGLDEFCVKREYRSSLKEIKRSLNVVSKFIASGYSIEYTRFLKYIADTTKDWRFDNDTFIVCVKRELASLSGLAVEQGIDCINVGTAVNIIDPATIYNARISPNRNFLRWFNFLLGNYYPNLVTPAAKFTLNTSEGNILAGMNLVNGCIPETNLNLLGEGQEIVPMTSAGGLSFLPIYKFELVEFDYPMSFSDYKVIKNNPRGVIEYKCNDMNMFEKGYIYSIQYKPNQGLATISLIPKF